MNHTSNQPNPPSTAPIKAELHSHSTFSDGEYSPEVLAGMCLAHDITLWSLTDHDTCEGARCALTLLESSQDYPSLTFIPGIEISARDQRSVHILGYGLDPRDEALSALFATRKQEREDRMLEMIALANARGFTLTAGDVLAYAPDGVLARPHLARALVEKGYVESTAKAFDLYLADDKPLYVASPYMSVEEAIAIIHEYHGVAILAHPGTSRRDEMIPQWIAQGLDGIECHHPAHSSALAAHYEGTARNHGVLISASSDFHGPQVTPDREFGRTFIAQERTEALLALIAARGGVVRHAAH